MALRVAKTYAVLLSALLAACASQPETDTVDRAELARAIIDEQNRLDTADVPRAESEPAQNAQETPAAPVWQLTADGAGLQHINSGYICPGAAADFQLFEDQSFPGLGHGNDVSCVYQAPDGGLVKLHITDFGRDVSPSAHLKGVTTSIKDTFNILREVPVARAPSTQEIAQSTAFQIRGQADAASDVVTHTGVWIERIGQWHIKARATYPADRAVPVATLIDRLFTAAFKTIERTDRIELPPIIDQ